MRDQSEHTDACPHCGSTTRGFRDAIDRLSREVEQLRGAADRRRIEELEGEVRLLRETVARLRGHQPMPHVQRR